LQPVSNGAAKAEGGRAPIRSALRDAETGLKIAAFNLDSIADLISAGKTRPLDAGLHLMWVLSAGRSQNGDGVENFRRLLREL
jgi:hypothetical protein